ncbi:GPAN1 protein, partial [Atractosteus spatula]|nr:GPAN1 protein [Atractosteus spatula]
MNGLISFTRAQEEGVGWLGVREGSGGATSQKEGALSGAEARLFYESLLESGERESRAESRRGAEKERRQDRGRGGRRPPPRAAAAPTAFRTSERDGHRLLKCAQDGDLPGLQELLEKRGCDVNFQDSYYWTAIMCAAYAGQRGSVRYLLQQGAAWVGVVDTQGRDAKDLAEEAGHGEVVRELEEYRAQPEPPAHLRSPPASEPLWCAVCQSQYHEGEETHRSSTLHQFSLRRPPPAPHYCLPPSSVGFRLMVREGWDPRSGLGPQGVGRKAPISTVLKRDHGGLGYGPAPTPRVTHFRPHDKQAVQRPPAARVERGATLTRRAERRREERERAWERNLRTYISL